MSTAQAHPLPTASRSHSAERPASVRGVFLLTCLKILLSWGFFAVFAIRGDNPDATRTILYTALAYLALALPMFALIHKRSALGVRALLGLALLASIPARAGIGILLDLVCLGLTFRASARQYFR